MAGTGNGAGCGERLARVMRSCWDQNPANRPTMAQVREELAGMAMAEYEGLWSWQQERPGLVCSDVLGCAVVCYAMLCYAMLCCAVVCYALLSCAVVCYAVVCCAALCYAMLW
eukprot:3936035-Rhodomonas_salina.2